MSSTISQSRKQEVQSRKVIKESSRIRHVFYVLRHFPAQLEKSEIHNLDKIAIILVFGLVLYMQN